MIILVRQELYLYLRIVWIREVRHETLTWSFVICLWKKCKNFKVLCLTKDSDGNSLPSKVFPNNKIPKLFKNTDTRLSYLHHLHSTHLVLVNYSIPP